MIHVHKPEKFQVIYPHDIPGLTAAIVKYFAKRDKAAAKK